VLRARQAICSGVLGTKRSVLISTAPLLQRVVVRREPGNSVIAVSSQWTVGRRPGALRAVWRGGFTGPFRTYFGPHPDTAPTIYLPANSAPNSVVKSAPAPLLFDPDHAVIEFWSRHSRLPIGS